MASQPSSISNDVTVDTSPRAAVGSAAGGHQPMALIEGSTPHLTIETQHLLRGRLRIVAILMFAGFALFLVKSLFTLEQYVTTFNWWLFADHVLVTAATGLVALGLCRECSISINKLRIAEVIVFGCPAAFFAVMDYVILERGAAVGFVVRIQAPWIMLMFLYAIFIPNVWHRAAVVIGALAAIPLAVFGLAWWNTPMLRAALENDLFAGYPFELAMVLGICAVSAVVGVRTIGTLRRQAFEAKQLGQYRLKRLIGAGGMGEVHLAEHLLMKRPCAVKVIRREKAQDPRTLARFEREVKAMAKLSHWNTVEIFDYGRSDDGTFYYAMEYLPGHSLNQLVELHGPLPPERVIHLLAQTCDALSEAHAGGVIHRDIKPGNIFAAYRGGVFDVAKLLDFGLAKPLLAAEGSSPELTIEGAITGSPLYMSPEQATGDHEATEQSDLYALGGVAYYLLTGQPPFPGDKPLQVMVAHAHKEVVPPSEHRADIPVDLEKIVMCCLEKSPADRFASAQELRDALLECDASGLWTREIARDWWHEYGCPKKKALDQEVLAGAGA